MAVDREPAGGGFGDDVGGDGEDGAVHFRCGELVEVGEADAGGLTLVHAVDLAGVDLDHEYQRCIFRNDRSDLLTSRNDAIHRMSLQAEHGEVASSTQWFPACSFLDNTANALADGYSN